MAALPQFSKSGLTTLVFSRGSSWTDESTPQPRQTVSYSESGQARIVTYFGEEVLYPLTFVALPRAEDALLLAWFRHASILWSAARFTYTDTDAIAHTVRLLENSYKRSRTPEGVTISFTLRREPF